MSKESTKKVLELVAEAAACLMGIALCYAMWRYGFDVYAIPNALIGFVAETLGTVSVKLGLNPLWGTLLILAAAGLLHGVIGNKLRSRAKRTAAVELHDNARTVVMNDRNCSAD